MFIILAHQRTGTHLLASLLNSHPNLRCYDEIFLIPGNRETRFGRKEFDSLKEKEGCIVMYSQYLRHPEKQEEIRQSKVIHLTRENLVNHAKSYRDTPAKLKALLNQLKKRVFKDKFDHLFEITYEDICGDKNITEYRNDNLLRFLGVKPMKLTTDFVKGRDP